MRYNKKGECMIEHHVKYKELHGYDETVWMTKGEHRILHNRLRKEGKCDVPVDVLNKISIAANQRTQKNKIKIKSINEAFMYDEYEFIKSIKIETGLNWHDFILDTVRYYIGDD